MEEGACTQSFVRSSAQEILDAVDFESVWRVLMDNRLLVEEAVFCIGSTQVETFRVCEERTQLLFSYSVQ